MEWIGKKWYRDFFAGISMTCHISAGKIDCLHTLELPHRGS